jgi:predicted permease
MNIINIMLPIILLVFTGWLLSKAEILNVDAENYLNKLVFNISFPAIMFISISEYGIKDYLDLRFAVAYILSVAITFVIAFGIFKLQKNSKLADCVFIGMNASVSNGGLIGMPILLGVFGVLGGVTSVAMLTISSIFIIPLFILIIEHEIQHHKINPFRILINAMGKTLMQPFIFATMIASILSLYSIHMPTCITTYLKYIADLTVPCALIAIGIRIANNNIKAIQLDLIFIAILSAIIKPVIALLIALALHLSKLYSISLIVVSAAPVASTVYILSARYNIYKAETAGITILTMFISLFTLPFFLWVGFLYWA